MAETTAPPPTPAAQPKPAAPKPAAPAPKPAAAPPPPAPKGVTRREFLYYVWGASMALFLVETVGVSVFFALPRFRVNQFGGIIKVNASDFPQPNAAPVANEVGKFWMVKVDEGIMANYKVCTHLGCIYKWDDLGHRFACPCHGSQFELNGAYIAGPAPRGLDRFPFAIYDGSSNKIAESTDGKPIPLPDNAQTIWVDTGKKVTGKSHF